MASPTQVEPLPPTETESPLLSSINQLSLTSQEVKNAPKKTNETQERRVESGYTRRPYVPKPVVVVEPVEPVVEHSELREVAAHVRRRDDNKVTALPPPLSKKDALSKTSASGNGGGGKDEGELGPGKPNDDGGDDGDGDGDDDDEAGGAGSVIEQESDTDDEYQSASEEQWPEETWRDDSALVRDVVPTSQEDISSAMESLNEFLALKKNNIEAVKILERDLESHRDDLLAVDDTDVSNSEAVGKAMKDLATLHHTLLENDDRARQEEIRIDLEEIASRTDKMRRALYLTKDGLRKVFLQRNITKNIANRKSGTDRLMKDKDITWIGRESYRLSRRLNSWGYSSPYNFDPTSGLTYALFTYQRKVWRVGSTVVASLLNYNRPLEKYWGSRVAIEEWELLSAGWVFQYPGIWRPADLNLKVGGVYLHIPELPSEYVGRLTIKERQRVEGDAGDYSFYGSERDDTRSPSV